MSLTLTWSITGLKTKTEQDFQDVVVQTYWKVTGVDENGVSGSFTGATPLSIPIITSEEFVEFDNLSEEKVLEWVQASVTPSTIDHITLQIQKQIDSTISPIVDKKLPWISVDESIL